MKETLINRTLVKWWLDVQGREAVYSPMIRSLSFSEPVPLGCELHKCFSVVPVLLHISSSPPQDGWKVLELGITLVPDQLGSDN